MSDREAFEKWAADKDFLFNVKAGEGYINVKGMAREVWQAAQAQVNQQLLGALQSLRFDVWADPYEEDRLWYEPCEDGSLLYYDQVVAAIAAAQEQGSDG